MAEKRAKVTSLRPLNSGQVAWLTEQGESAASSGAPPGEAWWIRYFGLPASEWSNPLANAVFYSASVWRAFREEIAARLAAARADKQVWAEMVNAGQLPPEARRAAILYSGGRTKRGGYSQKTTASTHAVPAGDPYALPEYFDWWQAENAFRRGYMKDADSNTNGTLSQTVRNRVKQAGRFTQNVALELSRTQDPAFAHFFTEYAAELGAGTAVQFATVSDLTAAAMAYREAAYQQFSPYYQPLLPGGGGGFFGLGAIGKRARVGTRVRFAPTAASYPLYNSPPPVGAEGTVTEINFGGGQKKSFLPGPGGGLLYVDWDGYGMQGVSPIDLELVRKSRKSARSRTRGRP
jgi:hypothetical protein